MCSLVMSLFSRDFIKIEIDQLKYQEFLTYVVNNYLHMRSICTAPGFEMV